MIIKGLTFIQTCQRCPEQYDVKDYEDNQVGYVRLRWGELICKFPDVSGETIYCDNVNDIEYFESEEQKEKYLNIIADKILKEIE